MAELIPPGHTRSVMTIPHAIIDAPEKTNTLVIHPHPFESRRLDVVVQEGQSLTSIVLQAGIPKVYHAQVRVWIEDAEVPRHLWDRVRPKAGRTLYIRVVPHGGRGGILASLLMLVVAVVAFAVSGPLATSALAAAGFTTAATTTGTVFVATKAIISASIMLVGGLLVNALIPPPKQDSKVSQRALLTGVRNRFAPYAPIPRIYGKRRTYPLQAARPYTEAQGRKRWLRALLLVGWGPLKISDIKIGETPIGVYSNVEYEVIEGWTDNTFGELPIGKGPEGAPTLFTKSVTEQTFQSLLAPNETVGAGPWIVRNTEDDAREISVDVDFPGGLFRINGDGVRVAKQIIIDVQYRAVGSGTWLNVVWDGPSSLDGTQTNGQLTCTNGNDGGACSFGGRWKVATAGQYEVRMRGVTNSIAPSESQTCFWTTLRTIRYENPINISGLCLIAVKMLATNQFQAFPDEINCIAESYTPIWDGSAWEYGLTQSPAWAYADLLRRRGTERFIEDSRIDLVRIKAWADACAETAPNAAEQYWRLNGTFEGGAVFDALRIAAAHGRASFVISDGKYSVVRDVEQTVPVQHITPRNSFGYSGTKAFVDYPHALKVQFVNEAKGFQEDELIVYRDGFDASNASKFETLELSLCTSATQAWREGRYNFAVGLLRPEEHSVSMDIESLRCEAGDLVRFTQDVISIGLGYGRIRSRIISGSNTTGFNLDAAVTMIAGVSYGIRVRMADGTSFTASLAPVGVSAEYTSVTLAAPVATVDAPDADDLFMFGELSRESAPMLVKKIEPGPNLTARVFLVDAQPGVWEADRGEIPAFDSYVSEETDFEQKRPPVPSFVLQSNEGVLERLSNGTLQDRIAVTFSTPPSGNMPADYYEVQFRASEGGDWIGVARVVYTTRTVYISPVEGGVLYDVRCRTISQYGVASDWVESLNHLCIGKTTPPADVVGFSALSATDGVQLSWTPNVELDVIGYEIRRGDAWDSALIVSEYYVGNTLFVALDSSASETFLIRAVDAVGVMSVNPVGVSVSVSAPGNVTAFDVFPLGDFLRFTWTPVPGNSVEYEIRNGDTWGASRVVGRSAGDTLTLKWPIREDGSPIYWIKAYSAAGLYSPDPFSASTVQAPLPNRNVLLDLDFSADTWAGGTLVRCSTSGTGVGSTLVADVSGGQTVHQFDYYRKVTLPLAIYARNWIEAIATASAGATLTWDEALFSWQDATERTWQGVRLDAEAVRLIPRISLPQALNASLIEGWTFQNTLNGVRSATPTGGGGAAYDDVRFGKGLVCGSGYSVAYSVAFGSAFYALFDFKPSTGARATDYTLLTITGGGGIYLRLRYVASSKTWVLEDQGGTDNISVVFDIADLDLLTFAIVQTATERRLMIFSHGEQEMQSGSGSFAAEGAMTGFEIDSSRGVYAAMQFWDADLSAGDFTERARLLYPLGYAPWRDFVPGDYEFENAYVWLSAEVADRSQEIVISQALMRTDAEDVVETGSAAVASPSSTIDFTRTFNVPPEVTAVQKSGATLAIARVSAVTETGFTVSLYDVSNPATTVSGTISFTAVGY